MSDDDRLLEALSAALAAPRTEPSDAEVAALRDVVARHFPGPRARPWWRRRAVTLLAAATLCTGTAAAVAGNAVPAPVRTLARAVGLPVDSAALVDTRAASGRLRAKLAVRDREGVARALEDLRTRIDTLSERDRHALGEETATLFPEADAFVTPPAPTLVTSPPAPPTLLRVAPRLDAEVDLEDRDHPPPPVCTVLEDAEADEPTSDDDELDEARLHRDEHDHESSEKRQREVERARREAQHEVERAQHEVERARRQVQHEVEKAQHQVEEAQHEIEKAQHQVEKAQHQVEKVVRQARDRAREKIGQCRDDEDDPVEPPEPDDDD